MLEQSQSSYDQEFDMGGMKDLQQQQHELEHAVVPYCIQAGLLTTCEYHEDIVTNDQPYEENRKHAYALVTNAWKAGRLRGGREECIEAVGHAEANAYFECPHCENSRHDD